MDMQVSMIFNHIYVHRGMDVRTNGWTYRRMNGQMDGRADYWVDEWVDEWVDRWIICKLALI